MQAITVVAIGDSEVGKTSLLFAALSNKLVTGHYTQRMFDSDPVSVNYASKIYSLTVHDVPGSMNPGWRNVYFKGAAVFLICFSVVNPESWAKVRTEYCPEIAHYCPGIPFIIVGTHRDLRSDKQTIKRLLLNGVSTITFQVGRELAKKVCAAGYIEISSLSGEHVPDLLANIIRVASPAMPGPEKSKASSFFSLGRLLNFVGDRFSPSQERALLNLQWTPLFSTSNGVARYGHIQAHFGTIVYTVGGVLEPIEPEILRYDISERRWLQPLPLVVTASELSTTLSGKTIQEMAFSASVFTGNFLFIFGGRSNNFSNSLYCFNMKTGEIALLPSEGSPTPRYGASMILFGKLLFVFGGYDNSGSVSDDLGCYDISTNHWKPIGIVPGKPARFHHSAVCHQGRMIIFGGIGDNSERLNDLWVFDCSSYDWTKPATRGAIPPPTRGHSAALINDGMFVCCSDLASPTTMALFRLDLKSYEWRRISVANSPPAREFATMISTDSGALILSGGRALSTGTTEKTHGDAWILHMYFNVFEFLPQELWMHVFSLCDPRTLFLLSAVCHHFSQMVSSDSLWERFILKELLNFRYELLPLKTFFRTSLAFHMYYAGTKFDEWMWLP